MAEPREIELNGKIYVLGKRYKDKLLGNVGIAVAGCAYLSGCDQIMLQWNDSTKRPVDQWVHVTDIEEIETATPKEPSKRVGGPAPRFTSTGK